MNEYRLPIQLAAIMMTAVMVGRVDMSSCFCSVSYSLQSTPIKWRHSCLMAMGTSVQTHHLVTIDLVAGVLAAGDFPIFSACRDKAKGERAVCCKSSKATDDCYNRDEAHGGYECKDVYKKTGATNGHCCFSCDG